MPIITLTSDWGLKDYYLAAVKGALLKDIPDAIIVDISHNIPCFNIPQAAFVVRNVYKNFPAGSIHMICVNTEASIQTPHVVVLHEGHYFIGTDNGIFPLLFDKAPEKIIEIDIPQKNDYFTFPERDVFVNVAAHIAKGEKLEALGHLRTSVQQRIPFEPITDKHMIKGVVIYVDAYGNAITNITESIFKQIGKNRSFAILFRGNEIKSIHKSYSDVPAGEIVALFASNGHLEIALRGSTAQNLLGLEEESSVRVEFKE